MAYTTSRTETLRLVKVWVQNGVPTPQYSNFTNSYYKEGRAVKNFRQRIMQGLDASSSYTLRTRRMWVTRPFFVYGEYRSDTMYSWTSLNGDGGLVWSPPQPKEPSSSAENLALANFIKKAQDEITAMESLPFLKELPQAKEMIGNRGTALVKSFTQARYNITKMYHRYRNLRKPWKLFTKDSSSKFLEYKFGWAPLMGDISSAFEELNSGITHYRPVVRGAHTEQSLGSSKTTTGVSYADYTIQRYLEYNTRVMYKCRFKLALDIPTRWGASPWAIPGACWEITPWSWLVDYIVDIQGFLNQWQVASLPRIYLSKSIMRKLDTWSYVLPPGDPSVTTTRVAQGSSRTQSVNYVRTPLSEFPIYVPQLNLAGPFNGAREWNVAAILGQRLKKY